MCEDQNWINSLKPPHIVLHTINAHTSAFMSVFSHNPLLQESFCSLQCENRFHLRALKYLLTQKKYHTTFSHLIEDSIHELYCVCVFMCVWRNVCVCVYPQL